ncbi:hypothetical protein [Aneurinibacillus danicus]|uniref:hypothetical protein n=1 Tax=Aneurinibacillus danicus TaxID=267746 RepID=UPI0035315583
MRKSGQDKYTKKLMTTAYPLLLLHAHLQSREGLRAIAADTLNEDFHEILGFTSIHASQTQSSRFDGSGYAIYRTGPTASPSPGVCRRVG